MFHFIFSVFVENRYVQAAECFDPRSSTALSVSMTSESAAKTEYKEDGASPTHSRALDFDPQSFVNVGYDGVVSDFLNFCAR